MKTLTVKGQTIGKAKFDSLLKAVGSINENVETLATYCAGLAVVHNDLDAINKRLLSLESFRLSSGEFNALGKKVIAYIRAHVSCFMTYDAQKKAFAYVKFTGKDASEKKAAARGFIDPRTGEIVCLFEALVTPESISFPMTFADFLSFKKEKEESDRPKSTKVGTVISSLEKTAQAAIAGTTAGTAEEYATAIGKALDLIKALAVAGGEALAQQWKAESDIDLDAFLTSVSVSPSSKAKAAAQAMPAFESEPVSIDPPCLLADAVAAVIDGVQAAESAKLDAELAESRELAKSRKRSA